MGHLIEINDTLKLKPENGFPAEVELGGVYKFNLPGRRIYNLKPTRVFLVEERDGKWNYIGRATINQQCIDPEFETTSGEFEVTLISPREYAKLVNKYESPAGKGFE